MQINSKVTPIERAPSVRERMIGSGMHGWLMMACCVAMIAGFGLVLYSGPADQSLLARAGIAAPLLLCVGMHLVMHRFMGKSCRGERQSPANEENRSGTSIMRRDA